MWYLNYNGQVLNEKQMFISHTNRGFRYADGFFETMRLINGKIILQTLHFERLYGSLEQMKFDVKAFPDYKSLAEQVIKVAEKNSLLNSCRVRLTVFAGNGTLHDNIDRTANYIIETSEIKQPVYTLNESGISVDFYRDAIKPADNFSKIKSNNFLPYVMAALWAKENNLGDAILLNPYNTIADATIANIFIVKDGVIQTPPLKDGPVDGVMRRYLLQCFKRDEVPFQETSLTMEDVQQASEVFLTNAIVGIKWVEKVGLNNYTSQMSAYLFDKYISPLATT